MNIGTTVKHPRLIELVVNALDAAQRGEGSSQSARTGKSPDHGYMVGGNGADEVRIPMNWIHANRYNLTTVAEKIATVLRTEYGELLYRESYTYLGSWVHNGELYFDVAGNFNDLDTAVDFAKARNEIAIWDVERGEEIYVWE